MSFNENNPPTSTLLISGDMRANFLATRRHMFSANLLQDPLFECWPNNDSTVPPTWQLGGSAPSIARNTGALNRVVGDMSAAVTAGAGDALLYQQILDTSGFDSYFDGRVVTAGCYAKTSTAAIARVRIYDGFDETDSAFHTGGGSFEWLDVEHIVHANANQLRLSLQVEAAGTVYWSGPVFLFSDIKPDRFVMPPTIRETLVHGIRGDAFLGRIDAFMPQRAFIVEHVQLYTPGGAPTGTALIADVNQWNGASFTSMFTTGGRPRCLAGSVAGGAVPNGTYNRRCFDSFFNSVAAGAGDILTSEVDQIGSVNPGADLNVFIRYKAWARPQEIFAAYNSVR